MHVKAGHNDGVDQRHMGATEKLHRSRRRRGQSAKGGPQQKTAGQPAPV